MDSLPLYRACLALFVSVLGCCKGQPASVPGVSCTLCVCTVCVVMDSLHLYCGCPNGQPASVPGCPMDSLPLYHGCHNGQLSSVTGVMQWTA